MMYLMRYALCLLLILCMLIGPISCGYRTNQQIPSDLSATDWFDLVLIEKFWKTKLEESRHNYENHILEGYYISFVDISGDGIPEVLMAYNGDWNRQNIFYHIFSLTDRDWITDVDNERLEILVSPKNDLFYDTYYVDPTGQKYCISLITTGFLADPDYLITKVWSKNSEINLTYSYELQREFTIEDPAYDLLVVKKEFSKEDGWDTDIVRTAILEGVQEFLDNT